MGRNTTPPQNKARITEWKEWDGDKPNVKVKLEGHDYEVRAYGRDYEILRKMKVGDMLAYNIANGRDGSPAFLNDCEPVVGGAAAFTEQVSHPLTNKDHSIIAQVCLKEATQIHLHEMAHGDNQSFDPVRITEIACDYANAYSAVTKVLGNQK